MIKLMQWILGFNIFFVLWLSLIIQQYESEYIIVFIQFLPLIVLFVFGVSTPDKTGRIIFIMIIFHV